MGPNHRFRIHFYPLQEAGSLCHFHNAVHNSLVLVQNPLYQGYRKEAALTLVEIS